jgi:LPPG:FO 2-phospho-L-lactate transferase
MPAMVAAIAAYLEDESAAGRGGRQPGKELMTVIAAAVNAYLAEEAEKRAREALQSADAVIICPSNPWVSIDPILRVIKKVNKPVVAISPILGGQTVKGPAAKMFRELGIEPSALAVANHYCDLLHGFVLDKIDEQLKGDIGINMSTMVTNTLMKDLNDRSRLAQDVLHFIEGEL